MRFGCGDTLTGASYQIDEGATVTADWAEHMSTLLDDLEAEAAADKRMQDTVHVVADERPPAEADGVDLAAITAADAGVEPVPGVPPARDRECGDHGRARR